MNSSNVFHSSSNYGSPVDFAAPGVNIATTNKGGGYSIFNGTSSAAPHMAGILLLTGGSPKSSGFVTGDKDSNADRIASK
jgi:subtilisin family serine protease